MWSVRAIAMKVKYHSIWWWQCLHPATGVGGQHVPRPQLARVRHAHTCADEQVTDVGRVEAVVILVKTKLARIRQIWYPRQRRKLNPVEEDQVLENRSRNGRCTRVFWIQIWAWWLSIKFLRFTFYRRIIWILHIFFWKANISYLTFDNRVKSNA